MYIVYFAVNMTHVYIYVMVLLQVMKVQIKMKETQGKKGIKIITTTNLPQF